MVIGWARMIPLLGAVAGLAALVAAGFDWRDARAARAEFEICSAAAGNPTKPLEGCPDTLAAAIDDARRAAECATAIQAGDLYAERATCSEAVKRRGAELAAAAANLADARAQIAAAERRTTAALARAEARAATQAKRTADATDALAQAPRGADGLFTCDAECLRRLSGGATQDGR